MEPSQPPPQSLEGVRRLIALSQALDETTPTRRALVRTAARHWRALSAWSVMLLNVQASERQLMTPFPSDSSPLSDGATRH